MHLEFFVFYDAQFVIDTGILHQLPANGSFKVNPGIVLWLFEAIGERSDESAENRTHHSSVTRESLSEPQEPPHATFGLPRRVAPLRHYDCWVDTYQTLQM